MTFVGKKDLWIRPISVITLALLAGSAYRGIVENGLNGKSIIEGALFVLMAWVYWGTYYRLDGHHLIVRCGPLKWTINIKTIKSIAATRNPLSSPALSLDRLEINYGENRKIRISPEDKNGFAHAILQINSKIQIIGDQAPPA